MTITTNATTTGVPLIVALFGHWFGGYGLIRSNDSLTDEQVGWVNVVTINSVAITSSCSYLDVNIWNHIIEPAMGEVPYGWVSFARVDRLKVLQALYKHASGSSLKYTSAREVGLRITWSVGRQAVMVWLLT